MKPGRASKTAELVCMGRALAHSANTVPGFDDPTAMHLLPDEAQKRVDRVRSEPLPSGLKARASHVYLVRQSMMMAARTVAIDDALRHAASPQVVILGAGLDGRAWRMTELRDAVVFEIDHPDSQRDKRARVSALTRAARDVKFVPVDFERDALGEALARAGHDAAQATTWVWEGVVMYLTKADVEATLAIIRERSAPGSRVIIAYHSPAFILHFVRPILRHLGEPLRSTFTAEAMRALLAAYGFTVVGDDDVHTIGARLSDEAGRATKATKHLRIVTADILA